MYNLWCKNRAIEIYEIKEYNPIIESCPKGQLFYMRLDRSVWF